MADHIFGFGKKVITESGGTLYDSGGPEGPYNANEEDYFIIRRTAAEYAAEPIFLLEFEEWSVADYSVATTDYDFIDVYKENTDAYDPSDWEWVERIGGSDLNDASVVATYYLTARNLKLIFRSSYRQNYTYDGFKMNFSTTAVASGTDLEALAATTYDNQVNLKENAGDSQAIINANINEDPAKTNWDFIPAKQFDSDEEHNSIQIMNYEFTNFNYYMANGKIPLSYTQPERSYARINTENISNITRERE